MQIASNAELALIHKGSTQFMEQDGAVNDNRW